MTCAPPYSQHSSHLLGAKWLMSEAAVIVPTFVDLTIMGPAFKITKLQDFWHQPQLIQTRIAPIPQSASVHQIWLKIPPYFPQGYPLHPMPPQKLIMPPKHMVPLGLGERMEHVSPHWSFSPDFLKYQGGPHFRLCQELASKILGPLTF